MIASDDGVDDDLLARIEDAGINASAPPQQRWVDGWLVRFSPGKAKRARCMQAVAAGRLPVRDKLALCLPIYAQAGLRPYVRITPFSQPAGLDDALAKLGLERIDDTRVMVMPQLAKALGIQGKHAAEADVRPASPREFAAWIGAARGSSGPEIEAHLSRTSLSPVPHRALLMEAHRQIVAGGQAVLEGDIVGLYDVFTAEGQRRRGHAEAVCRALLKDAVAHGARIAYLQVDAANEAALRIYRRLGFIDGYGYHYRTPPSPVAGP